MQFWGQCVLTACHLINRTPSALLSGKTPFERLHSCPPTYQHMRVFGCLAYVHNVNHKGDKFAPRSRRCVFIGYPSGKKGWTLFDLEQEIVFQSRDVVFLETIFPFTEIGAEPISDIQNPSPITTPMIEDIDGTPLHPGASPSFDDVTEHHNTEETTEPETPLASDITSGEITEPETSLASETASEEITASKNSSEENTEHILGRGHRPKIPSSKLRDYVVGTVVVDSPLSLSSTSLSP